MTDNYRKNVDFDFFHHFSTKPESGINLKKYSVKYHVIKSNIMLSVRTAYVSKESILGPTNAPLRRSYYRRIRYDKTKAIFYGIKFRISIFKISTDNRVVQ